LLFLVSLKRASTLENAGAAELLRFVSASPKGREQALEAVTQRGELTSELAALRGSLDRINLTS
jgi:hypothetical protein